MKQRVQIPMIIGITHTDCPGAWSEEDVFIALGYTNESSRPPIIRVNATQRESVAEAVILLVQQLMLNCASEM
jgi:hypothetical protein